MHSLLLVITLIAAFSLNSLSYAQTLGEWASCTDSAQCLNRCCSQEYSDSLKCTPNMAGAASCVSGSGSGTSLDDWSVCSANAQCASACCSGQYSGGILKCHPAGSSDQCAGGDGSGLADWSVCSSNTQCSSACCSGQYSGGVLKCHPAGSSDQCAGGGGSGLADWSECSASTQCASACCSGQYSEGVLKCHPAGSSDRCVAGGTASGRYQFYKYSPDVSILAALIPRSEKVVLQGRLPEVSYDDISPILNGTHSYELDVTNGDFYTQHVETNMFCGGGTIMPDNLGRMMTVGGWMDGSLMAVRLYKPTGGPGVASRNDWEENRNTVHLKVPRWYPTVVTVPSGEILLIGGATENTMNIEQPNAEYIPPRSGPAIHIPILAGKGSSSQYPNSAVMPSGSLFVMAGQSSQLLSLSTLGAIKTLPNVAGGLRTYPCLGGFAILPLAPPYTNAQVIACGGCGGQGPALQNCGRISPELSNPTWSYEDMPNRRVLGNFIQLPDGKLLLVNGAEYGSAGFAAATTPQLTALVYDPEASAGSRFTVGGTTNIPRMYHSCATLLADGRVLISGSDAFDPSRFPPERRLEFYIPFYYDQPRPTLTLEGGRDLAYNSLLTVNVVLREAGTVRFNILKVGANTHSLSFDQRLVWLAATGDAGTYSLTMPPNGNVAPPGWYALHVVENGIPSVASWIRLGGDPSNLFEYPGAGESDFDMSGLSSTVDW